MTHRMTTAIKPSRSNGKNMDWTSEWDRLPCPWREPLAPPHVPAAPYAALLRYGPQEPAVAHPGTSGGTPGCEPPMRVGCWFRGYRPLPGGFRHAGEDRVLRPLRLSSARHGARHRDQEQVRRRPRASGGRGGNL